MAACSTFPPAPRSSAPGCRTVLPCVGTAGSQRLRQGSTEEPEGTEPMCPEASLSPCRSRSWELLTKVGPSHKGSKPNDVPGTVRERGESLSLNLH